MSSVRLTSEPQYTELVPLKPDSPSGVPEASRAQRWLMWLRARRLFLLCVALPTLLAGVYLGVFAVDRYVSEASFIVRTPKRPNMGGLSTLMQGAGVSVTLEDAYVVHVFLKSRDALRHLMQNENLRAVLGRANGDPLWRYPALFQPDLDEKLYEYYLRLIDVKHDDASSISTLVVQAFDPHDAERLARSLLGAAEELINRLNERARLDTVRAAEAEVDEARRRARDTRQTLTEFREREKLLDLGRSSANMVETIAKLSLEAALVNARITELQMASPQSPQLDTLRGRLVALERQITEERRQIGGTATPLAPRLAEYERLVLDREFADRSLVAALNSLDTARNEARRQGLYLERIVEPIAADEALYPRRALGVGLVFVFGLGLYFLIRTLAANVRAHRIR